MRFESVYFSRLTIIVSNSCSSYSFQEVAQSLAGTSESVTSREFRKKGSSNAISPGASVQRRTRNKNVVTQGTQTYLFLRKERIVWPHDRKVCEQSEATFC